MSIIRKALVAAAILLFAMVLAASITPAVADAASPWKDLPTPVLEAYGLTQDDIGRMSNGYLDGTWRPDDYVTRGQFVKLALGYFGILQAELTLPHFSDVPQSSPQYRWVERGLEIGLVSGYEVPSATERTVFGLYDPITREQAATILMRYLAKMEPSSFDLSAYTAERANGLLGPFLDKGQVRRTQEVAMALDTKVLRPVGAYLMPEAHLTRIQAAALIVRTQSLLPPPPPPPPPPDGSGSYVTPLTYLISDAYAAGIQVDFGMLGSAAPWLPSTLSLRARLQGALNPAAYEEMAGKLVSLAEQYQDQMHYEQVHIVIAIPGGAWVYDHTFEATPPPSATTGP